jgi:5'-3' exonuclease
MKVHLIDGTYELFRAYYGAPGATSPGGVEVGATRGLLRSLAALLRRDEVTHVGIAFDTEVESFRNQLFDGYKTGEGMEPELWAQFPLAERAARALGLVTWSMIEFEADDALATAASLYGDDERVDEIFICSPDKDLCQCVLDPKVKTWDRMRERIYDEAAVVEKFGVEPRSIPDYLALVGDSADGIPGLPKWGAKSSATVLAHYGHINDIPGDETSWPFKVRGAAGLAAVLRERREDAELYRHLALLRRDVPLAESLEELEWRGASTSELDALCEELGTRPPRL